MSARLHTEQAADKVSQRAAALFAAWQDKTFRRTDRMFASLMAVQFVAGVALALWISPRAWAGETSSVHLHVWAAVLLGGLLSGFPILLALTHGGTALTRHSIAVGQMLTSALLIHLTGGRIETHFHVFGSLAFLAFYRDWRVLVTATVVVAVDHFMRGLFWPQSVFGVVAAPVWRAMEHAGWVVFEDLFLLIASREMLERVRESVTREAQLEATNESIERTVAELTASETRSRAIFESAPDALVMVNSKGRITVVNAQAETLFGYSRAELIGQPVEVLAPQRHRSQLPGYVAGFFIAPERRAMGADQDLAGLRKDGTEVPIEVGLNPLTTMEGEFVLASVIDITERKRADDQIRRLNQSLQQQTREIGAANRELTDFAYVVSHDLKAPLRGISSLSNWLAADYADKLDDAGRNQLSLMTIRVKRLNALIDGILAYSRAGRSREERVPVDLDAVVKYVAEILAPPSHIRIEFETSLPSVEFELIKAQQLFQNLLGNAIKYMDKPQGRIRVRCDARDGFWEFAVGDNGPGIETKYFEKVFQLFQTLEPRDDVEGTGVGLALVKKIVENEGGRVWVESTPGAGATFLFTLPRS